MEVGQVHQVKRVAQAQVVALRWGVEPLPQTLPACRHPSAVSIEIPPPEIRSRCECPVLSEPRPPGSGAVPRSLAVAARKEPDTLCRTVYESGRKSGASGGVYPRRDKPGGSPQLLSFRRQAGGEGGQAGLPSRPSELIAPGEAGGGPGGPQGCWAGPGAGCTRAAPGRRRPAAAPQAVLGRPQLPQCRLRLPQRVAFRQRREFPYLVLDGDPVHQDFPDEPLRRVLARDNCNRGLGEAAATWSCKSSTWAFKMATSASGPPGPRAVGRRPGGTACSRLAGPARSPGRPTPRRTARRPPAPPPRRLSASSTAWL